MKRTIWMLLTALALTACDKEDNEGAMPADGRIEIVTGVEALTRAPQLDDTGAGNFRTGDTFTLTVSSNGKSVQKDYTVGSTTLYWQGLGIEGDKVTFAGCYPNHGGADASTFEFDVRSALDADLLLAPAVEVPKGAKSVAMPFRHAMHKLVVKYVADDTYATRVLSGISTTLHAHTVCMVDLSKGNVAESSAKTPADYTAKNGENVSWLVVPQNRDGVKLTVTLDGQSREFTLPETTVEGQPLTTLDGGKMLSVTLRVSKNGITLERTTIGKWEDQGSIDGEIEI
ncbi:fimbrillin family protein [Coprobacter fastidiosus]|uniref:Fimbrillin-like protein n=1 Tax=Coprobacter fastidiosus NSB1 = JCM 33896 TaxID=1349822 RepID=A0A495WD14_9BACT|nr:fimbrillin family protein [Coprobacter fastidiosus]ERM90448.1 hypothetical protein NSB1T_00990 [Coprobacter fastidiosus NSB1 = JCM 33896]RKT59120.1 fimbrillin-like protein [Coprobacter fastidiosus NSB1 = JCM 33896]